MGHGGAARLSIMGFAIERVTAQPKQTALRKKWLACGLKEDQPRQVILGDKTYTEVGRRNEKPLKSLPEAWLSSSFLTFTRPNPGDLLDYTIPKAEEICRQLDSFAAPKEDQPIWFGIHAMNDLKEIRVSCSGLAGKAGSISVDQIENLFCCMRPLSRFLFLD